MDIGGLNMLLDNVTDALEDAEQDALILARVISELCFPCCECSLSSSGHDHDHDHRLLPGDDDDEVGCSYSCCDHGSSARMLLSDDGTVSSGEPMCEDVINDFCRRRIFGGRKLDGHGVFYDDVCDILLYNTRTVQ